MVLLLTPVFFLVYSDRPFDPSKASLIRVLAVTAGAAWFAKALTGGRPWRPAPASATAERTRIARWLIAAVLLSCAALVVSAALSIDPRMSWQGSYGRSLGVSTRLAAVVFFLLCAGHLRDRRQMLRILGVVWWGSVPVCLYTLLQSLGLDPVARGSVLVRPGSTLGNPIFLGAYLGFAFFLGLALLHMVLRRESGSAWRGLRHGVLISVCGLQIWALVTASSRGPVLGVLMGLAFLGWLILIRRTWRRDAIAGRIDWRRILAIGFLILIAGAAIPALRLARGVISENQEPASRAGRLIRLVSPETRNARVRLLVWQGALDTFAAPAPLPAVLDEDRWHPWRPWVGYGSESAAFALGHHEPVELERLEADRTPDNAHNLVLQTVVSGGVLGVVAWCLVQLLTLAVAATALGAIRGRTELLTFSALVVVGGVFGALLPWVGLGGPALGALGGVAGGLCAFAIWMFRLSWISPDRTPRAASGSQLLGGILFAAWLSRLIEGQFGIQVTTVMIYGMAALAALVVVASGWLEPLDPAQGAIDEIRLGPGSWIPAALFSGILVLVFAIARHDASELVWSRMEHQHAAGWLILASVAAGLALVKDRRGLSAVIGGAVGGGACLLVALHMVRGVEGDDVGDDLASVAWVEADMAVVVLVAVVISAMAWGWRLSSDLTGAGEDLPSVGEPIPRFRTAVVTSCCVVVVLCGCIGEVRSLRSSVLTRGAMSLAARHRFSEALEMMQFARRLNRRESRLALLQGRINFDQAQIATDPTVREDAMNRSRAALDEALDLAPFDADHVANLGLWHLAAVRFTGEGPRREQELEAAIWRFSRALEMRPAHVPWRRELAEAMRLQGNLDGAIENLETVRETLDTDIDLLLDLAQLHREKAIRATEDHATEDFRRFAEEAVRLADLAVALDPEDLRSQLAALVSRSLLGNE